MSPKAKLGLWMAAASAAGAALNYWDYKRRKSSAGASLVVGAAAGLGTFTAVTVVPELLRANGEDRASPLGGVSYQALPPGGYVAPFTRWPFGAHRFW